MGNGIQAGNIHLRGRKTKLLGCRWCTAVNLREAIEAKDAQKEIHDAIDEWHRGDSEEELHDYLGWSIDEYREWLNTGEVPHP